MTVGSADLQPDDETPPLVSVFFSQREKGFPPAANQSGADNGSHAWLSTGGVKASRDPAPRAPGGARAHPRIAPQDGLNLQTPPPPPPPPQANCPSQCQPFQRRPPASPLPTPPPPSTFSFIPPSLLGDPLSFLCNCGICCVYQHVAAWGGGRRGVIERARRDTVSVFGSGGVMVRVGWGQQA